ncbi:Glutaredoxin [Andreprevotia lacus DSM 23236]|uniref:Glutaredoxin n=1 Tax=Andreprevotia lacus DSM 23236 TaxID=1121001 RepID=A0A1W1XMX0_9NEIS|nr:glutaredoxin domain-containing protein [Andreprevotia lacus]SMC25339.1 Glutaredoxin [Andreprevotia lacus DSM 23236]
MNGTLRAALGIGLILLVALLGGVLTRQQGAGGYESGDYRSYYSDSVRVVLYGTDWCQYCARARAYFNAKGVAWHDLDVEKQPAAAQQFERLGGTGYPVVLIGNRKISGFDPIEYDAALAALQAPQAAN